VIFWRSFRDDTRYGRIVTPFPRGARSSPLRRKKRGAISTGSLGLIALFMVRRDFTARDSKFKDKMEPIKRSRNARQRRAMRLMGISV
jgi:hypothetical protein